MLDFQVFPFEKKSARQKVWKTLKQWPWNMKRKISYPWKKLENLIEMKVKNIFGREKSEKCENEWWWKPVVAYEKPKKCPKTLFALHAHSFSRKKKKHTESSLLGVAFASSQNPSKSPKTLNQFKYPPLVKSRLWSKGWGTGGGLHENGAKIFIKINSFIDKFEIWIIYRRCVG